MRCDDHQPIANAILGGSTRARWLVTTMPELARDQVDPTADIKRNAAAARVDERKDEHGFEPSKAVDSAAERASAQITFASKTNLWLLPIPSRARYDTTSPPPTLSLPLNILFGVAATFTVANLYYSQPILVQLAEAFGPGITYNQVSVVTTLVQAGYAAGILLISPLGDMVRRRSLILLLVFLTATLSIGLALMRSLLGFQVLGFFVAMLSVTPQIMIPLTADLAPAHRRSSAIAITISGLMLGLLIARVLSGTITRFSSWRNVYWMSVGLQYVIFVALYFALPDYPRKVRGVNYFQMLWSMVTYIFRYPTLVQTCLIGFLSSSVFANWWTTLSFLLSDAPYNYNSFEIGLFGLAGLAGVCAAPFMGRLVDGLVPWVGQLLGLCVQIAFQAIATGAADRNVAAVVIVAFGLDVGLQLSQVSNSTRIYALNPDARARINSVFIISLFLGQTMGSAAGTRAYTARPGGGWHASSGLSVGLLALAIVVLLARGPHAEKWIGWDGGSNLRKGKMTNTAAAGGAPGSVVATTDDDEEEKSPGKEAIVERNDVEKG